MKYYRAEQMDALSIPVGESVKLESLRQAVVPPYLMLMPYIEVPDEITVEKQEVLEEEGVHGCVYQLKSEADCEGEIVIGFKDIQTGEITHRKVLSISTSD